MKHKIKNPLIKRIPKELLGDWRKYTVVALFLILTVGFVSGMYIANDSMEQTLTEGYTTSLLEDGHFELESQADSALLAAIAKGDLADMKQYLTDEAFRELDAQFDEEFDEEFQKTFDEEFSGLIEGLWSAFGVPDEEAADLAETLTGDLRNGALYSRAYDDAYEEAYDEAYEEAKTEILDEIEEKYAEAEETYGLDDPDYEPVPVSIYETFYRSCEEDNDLDGIADGTIRVYSRQDEVNLASVLSGRLPETENEIAIDRMHADNAGVTVGDSIRVDDETYEITGLIAYVNYATLHENNSDFMFDALKFDVAMLTPEGYARLTATEHYTYAWTYETSPADENEEKALSDTFLKALLTQVVTAGNEIEDYIPRYANSAVHFAPEDMGSDKAMGGVLLDVLIVIIAFIFAITISNTIVKESSTIGTLRASGYTKRELILHYLSMPVIVTLLSAVIGNILGYTVFTRVVTSMYYNSYSLPEYHQVWNSEAFIKTTVIPVILMFAVNLIIIVKTMAHTPLQFLRHDLKKSRRKRSLPLPNMSFLNRFRLRILLQNIPHYFTLLVGILFVAILLAMAVGMPATLKQYTDNMEDMVFSQYQYILSSYEDEDGNEITTANPDAEKFDLYSLQKKGGEIDEEISVYGVVTNSRYISIENLSSLAENEVYISETYSDKYGISVGDEITLDEKYENKQYTFRVAGIFVPGQSLAVYLPMERFAEIFELKDGEFTGYLSDTEITDIDEDVIATTITVSDFTKMADQLNHSMGSYMTYFQYLCILISAILIYLLTKIIVEKNEISISMTKILGYNTKEIAGLYLHSTTIVMLIGTLLCTILGTIIMDYLWRMIMRSYSGWFVFMMNPLDYVKIFSFILAGYLLVLVFDYRRIQKIPMDEALKAME